MLFEIRLNELTKSLCFTVAAKTMSSASTKVDKIIFDLEQNHNKVFTGFSTIQKQQQLDDCIYSVCKAGTHKESNLMGDEITAHKITVGKKGHNGKYKIINNNVNVKFSIMLTNNDGSTETITEFDYKSDMIEAFVLIRANGFFIDYDKSHRQFKKGNVLSMGIDTWENDYMIDSIDLDTPYKKIKFN